MSEKIPPHNAEAEKSALGAALLSKDALTDIIDAVTAADFYEMCIRDRYYSAPRSQKEKDRL